METDSWMGRWWCAIDQYKGPILVWSPIADQRGRILSEMIPLLAQQSAELLKLYGYSSGSAPFLSLAVTPLALGKRTHQRRF